MLKSAYNSKLIYQTQALVQ